ncbi:hypothetical protein BH23PLA1_BH23PLA1_03770 [soil metagenome]
MTPLQTLPHKGVGGAPVAEAIGPVLVACPDARPPAYQAAVGLARFGTLGAFLTGFYHQGDGPLLKLARRIAPGPSNRLERTLKKRQDPEIPSDRVRSTLGFDLALAVERRLPSRRAAWRRRLGRWRTEHFDRLVARELERTRPASALIFSDVGSEFALPNCKRLGIASVLSMVHGDVREERRLLKQEAERSPKVFRLYLGDASLDRQELNWLHERRLRDIELADLILVPSEHIGRELMRNGTPRSRIRVIPYAADTRRFQPKPDKRHDESCTFLFAGGISQRKGISYLLRAWQQIRRPGWRLQLLGAPPRDLAPLAGWLEGVELLGRVPHAEVPVRMAEADVFAFPSLFEGSAVVTYEALACGLPSVVTPSAGSVVRDGMDGFLVPPADVEALALSMERLGVDPDLRAEFSASARYRAEMFDWPRYHEALAEAIGSPQRPWAEG